MFSGSRKLLQILNKISQLKVGTRAFSFHMRRGWFGDFDQFHLCNRQMVLEACSLPRITNYCAPQTSARS